MSAADLEEKILSAFEKISDVVKSQQWELGKKHGLTPIQLNVLLFLKDHKPELRKPALLAKEFLVSKPTITETINSLTRKNLVVKEKDEKDTRSSFLHLTDDGNKLVGKLLEYPKTILNSFGAFPDKKKSDLYQALMSVILEFQKDEIITLQRTCFNCKHYSGDKKLSNFCSLLDLNLEPSTLRLDCADFERSEV